MRDVGIRTLTPEEIEEVRGTITYIKNVRKELFPRNTFYAGRENTPAARKSRRETYDK